MKNNTRAIIITILLAATPLLAAGPGDMEKDYPIHPVAFTQVQIDDEFWAPRMETNRVATIPYAFEKCEETDRISNFAKAGGLAEGGFIGTYFNDSDVYKVMEGAAYALALKPDPKLEAYLDGVIAKVAAAQEDDGYLYTARTLQDEKYSPPGGKERWSDIPGGHELYCVGHLYEAAAAHYQATGKRTLLDVALKNADLIDKVFGPGRKAWPPGHQEIEIGLSKLYRVTGDEKYLRLAKFFLDIRGHYEGRHSYGSYSQDHKPVIEQEKAQGHAVRAAYMFAGMADVAALTGDTDYITAIGRLWDNVVGRQIYITGGLGAAGGHEGFGEEYDLPNTVAYCETCAAIANVFWNHRLFLLHGDGRYIDVLERTLYNGMLSGVSLDGKTFFYPNPLESVSGSSRSPWFGCACCPSNVARFFASIPRYLYAHRDDEIYVNLYAAGQATIPLEGGAISVRQETRYPWDGEVKLTVDPKISSRELTLNLRVPGWARNEPIPSDLYRFQNKNKERPTLLLNGKPVDITLQKGYASVRRVWTPGDTLTLRLPMPVRRVLAHEKVKADEGKTALQRGPVVYCVEGLDVQDGAVANLLLTDDEALDTRFQKDLLGGVQTISGKAWQYRYGTNREILRDKQVGFTAIPYHVWAHREQSEMAVWLARQESAVRPLPGPTIAGKARPSASAGNAKALNDQREPSSSGDHSNPFQHWWPKKDTLEWVQYDFEKEQKVSSVEIYWFDDTGRGACRLPASWRLLYRSGQEWKPVANPSAYGCEIDKYNKTTFDAVATTALRVEVQLPEEFAAGIHEWRVE